MEMELNLKLEHADSSRHWSHSLDTEEDQGESMGQGSDAGAANTSLMTIMWAEVGGVGAPWTSHEKPNHGEFNSA